MKLTPQIIKFKCECNFLWDKIFRNYLILSCKSHEIVCSYIKYVSCVCVDDWNDFLKSLAQLETKKPIDLSGDTLRHKKQSAAQQMSDDNNFGAFSIFKPVIYWTNQRQLPVFFIVTWFTVDGNWNRRSS